MKVTGNELTFTVLPGEECLLRTFIRIKKNISRKSLSAIKNNGYLLCNGENVTVRHMLSVGDVVILGYPVEEKSEFLLPEQIDFDILHEDRDVLVINKPAGLTMHPTWGVPSGTLANGVIHHWIQQGDEESAFHAVNRLDSNTSGIVLVAKNKYAKQQLTIQQRTKQLQRSYVAICEGVIEIVADIIDAPIGRDDTHSVKRTVRDDGQLAQTEYEVLERFEKFTFVRVMPKTGRTHQIRVHMAYIGHPLTGDDMYGGHRDTMSRHALHADVMQFEHPRTGEVMSFAIDLPFDMQDVLKKERNQ